MTSSWGRRCCRRVLLQKGIPAEGDNDLNMRSHSRLRPVLYFPKCLSVPCLIRVSSVFCGSLILARKIIAAMT